MSHASTLARTAPFVLIVLLVMAYVFAPHQAGAPLPLAGGAPAAAKPTVVSGLAAVAPAQSERAASIAGRTGRTGFAPSGPLVADLGFRPAPDGFSFQNYASNFPSDPATLTIAGARTLFGDAVCAAVQLDGTCIASPLAEQWLAQMNLFLNTGRCEGLAALSQAIFLRRTTPAQLDPAAGATFELHRDSPAVSELVSAYAVTQFLEPVASTTAASRSRTPAELLNELIATLQPGGDPPTLGMYEPSVGGHAVTPFAVEDTGNNLFRVWVYDNNFPGAAKYVEIDSAANTWRYAAAALNPSHDPAPWQGDANSHTLDLTPASARTAQLVCPFCPPPAVDPGIPAQNDARAAPRQLVLSGDAHLLAVDALGRRLGFDGDTFLSEIPGAAHLTWRSNADGSESAIYSVPNGIDLTLQLHGRDGPAAERFAMFSPGGVLAISDMQLTSGRADVVRLAGDGRISYTPGGSASPQIDLAVHGDGAQYAYTVGQLSLAPGASLMLSVDPSGKLDVSSNGTGTVENVSVRRVATP